MPIDIIFEPSVSNEVIKQVAGNTHSSINREYYANFIIPEDIELPEHVGKSVTSEPESQIESNITVNVSDDIYAPPYWETALIEGVAPGIIVYPSVSHPNTDEQESFLLRSHSDIWDYDSNTIMDLSIHFNKTVDTIVTKVDNLEDIDKSVFATTADDIKNDNPTEAGVVRSSIVFNDEVVDND